LAVAQGLGLRPPAVSWGVMLRQAQNIQVVATMPLLMLPAVPVIVAVLAFNFLGDGLRDAADPYGISDSHHGKRTGASSFSAESA
jgi:peptide/nickel transport system permease protein